MILFVLFIISFKVLLVSKRKLFQGNVLVSFLTDQYLFIHRLKVYLEVSYLGHVINSFWSI